MILEDQYHKFSVLEVNQIANTITYPPTKDSMRQEHQVYAAISSQSIWIIRHRNYQHTDRSSQRRRRLLKQPRRHKKGNPERSNESNEAWWWCCADKPAHHLGKQLYRNRYGYQKQGEENHTGMIELLHSTKNLILQEHRQRRTMKNSSVWRNRPPEWSLAIW